MLGALGWGKPCEDVTAKRGLRSWVVSLSGGAQ